MFLNIITLKRLNLKGAKIAPFFGILAKNMRHIILLYFLFVLSFTTSAQDAATIAKLKSEIRSNPVLYNEILSSNKAKSKRIEDYLKTHPQAKRLENKRLLYNVIDGKPIYVEDHNTNAAIGTRTNYLQVNGDLALNLEGEGLKVGIWEVAGIPKPEHSEFSSISNKIQVIDEGNDPELHATHVTGTILAEGVNSRAKGMAPKAKAYAYDTTGDDVELLKLAKDSLLLVSNHSYGVPVDGAEDWYFGNYSSDTRKWDVIANNSPYILSVHAAGNDGSEDASDPFIPRGDKLSSAKVAKNTLTVGSANFNAISLDENGELIRPRFGSVSIISNFSSEGPTDDLRIKPDVLGVGEALFSTSVVKDTLGNFQDRYATLQGTSMAAPNVAGTILLLQELYFNENNTYMKSATVKALLCSTASDVGATGPDYRNGWGLVNAKRSAQVILNNATSSLILEKALDTVTREYEFEFNLSDNSDSEIALVWNDPAGDSKNGVLNDTTPVLVNDLDLMIIGPDNTEYYPWKLNEEDPASKALKGVNNRDNVEIINLESLDLGIYKVVINYKGELTLQNTSEQEFSVIVSNLSEVSLSNQIFAEESIAFWPNPVKNQLNVSYSENNFSSETEVSIYDMTGREIINLKDFDSTSNLSIDVSTLSNGIYILNLKDGTQSIQKKIIKE